MTQEELSLLYSAPTLFSGHNWAVLNPDGSVDG